MRVGAACLLASAMLASPALAQQAADAGDAAEAEEIVVAGYRGSPVSSTVLPNKPVLDTPFSVNSLGSELLRDQQAISFTDVVRNDPSIVLAFPQYDDTINLRGFYQNHLYREGLPTTAQVRAPFQNKERIDVFKGLSGFRFGFNSPGGVVNFVVKRPTESPQLIALAGGDSHGSYYAQLDAGGRFGPNDQFGARVNLFANEIDSFRNNVDGRQRLYSGIVDWRATPDLTIEAEYERFENRGKVFSISYFDTFGSDPERARALLPLIEPEATSAQPWIDEDRVQELFRLGASYRFAEHWTASLSAHRVQAETPYGATTARDLQPDGSYTLFISYIPDFDQDNTALAATLDGRLTLFGIRNDVSFGYVMEDRTGEFRGGYNINDVSTYLGGTRRGNLFTGETIAGSLPPPGLPGEQGRLGFATL